MRLLLASALLLAVGVVQGGINPRGRPAWMLWPGEDGKPQVAILRGGPEVRFDPAQVTFHLFTRSNPSTSKQMFIGNMNGAPFDRTKDTKFIVHGFTSSGFTEWIIKMKDEYLAAGDYNVISVDWERPAQGPYYDNAKQRTKPTGLVLGDFMHYLKSQGGDLNRFHCTGHSLGAHACGFAGEGLRGHGETLGRVTGLDPALPLFDYNDLADRLDPSDASFVDVIHTCGGTLAFWHPLGHADFYPNNGELSQPGCGIDATGSCSHERAHIYFHESIRSTSFRSLRCDSWQEFRGGACNNNEKIPMGEQTSRGARLSYYLHTRGTSPYAEG